MQTLQLLPDEPRSLQQIEEELKAQVRQQAAVADLGLRALASSDLAELINEAIWRVTETLELEYSKVLELLPDGKNLLLRAGVGWEEGWVGHTLVNASTDTQAGYTLLSTEPTVIEDWHTETRFTPSLLFQSHQVVSGMSVVIAGHQQPFGILGAFTSQKRTFTRDEIYFLQAVANVLAMAIERAQTEESLRQQSNLIELAGEPIMVWDFDNGIIFWNKGCESLYGFSREEAIGQVSHQLLQTIHPIPVEQFRATLVRERQWAGEVTHIARDGRRVVVESRQMLAEDTNGRRLVLEANRNITERKRAEVAQQILAGAGKTLASSLDYSTRLSTVAWLAVPQLADWCVVDVVETGAVHQVAIAHSDPGRVKLAQEWRRRFPPDWDAPTGAPQVIRTGQSELYPEISEAMIEASTPDNEQRRLLKELGLKSAMVVPLMTQGRILGAMTFISAESGQRYDEFDLDLAEELARRAATAIDNARSYKAEQEARQEAESAARRITSLQTVTAALSEAVTPAQVAEVILEKGLEALGANSGVIVLLDEAGENLEVLYDFGYPPEVLDSWRSFPLSAPVPLAETVRSGEPVFLETGEEVQVHFPDFERQRASRYTSLVSLPLTIEGEVAGGIGLSFVTPQTFNPEERDFMVVLARQCAQALERARLYEAERSARAEAEAAQQRLAALVETRERNRVAQELHDTVAQALGYLNLKLAAILTSLGHGQIETVEDSLQEVKQIVAETYTDVREEIFNLRANTFEGLSFLELLHRYIDKYRSFYKLDIELILETDEALFEFPAEVGPQLIRTIQEALINVRKHAKVNRAIIRLSRAEDQVRISVEDQGRGFEPARLPRKSSSFGLQIMRERVESVGGALQIYSTPGQGTRIVLSYPLADEAQLPKE